MASITLKGTHIETSGILPELGKAAPPFSLVKTDLSVCELADFKDKTVILNIFPSIDTPTCATSVRTFNEAATRQDDTFVLCISADLPFAHKRFCETEGIRNVIALSTFRSPEFGASYGLTITTGALKGLLSRAIVVIDGTGTVMYTEQVPEIGMEPNYQAALNSL